MARWLVRLDRRGVIEPVPAQTPGLASAMGIDREELESAAWLLRPDGRLHRGAEAMAAAFDALLPTSLEPALSLYRLPPAQRIADSAYRMVAVNRHRLPGVPKLALGGDSSALSPVLSREIAQRIAPNDSAT